MDIVENRTKQSEFISEKLKNLIIDLYCYCGMDAAQIARRTGKSTDFIASILNRWGTG